MPKRYMCRRAVVSPSLDGTLTHPAWNNAEWTDDFVDIEGDAKPKPRFRTRAKMLWDDTCFYVAAEMEEPHLWATLTEHDSVIFHDNDFELFIDPDGDTLNYYEIEINALNTTWDLFLPKPYRDGGSAVNEWECVGMRTAVHLRGTLNDPTDTDDGWSVELAMPWAAFDPETPKPGEVWRVNFSRVQWRLDVVDGLYQKPAGAKEDNWVWSPQGVVDMHQPEQWGFVEFV